MTHARRRRLAPPPARCQPERGDKRRPPAFVAVGLLFWSIAAGGTAEQTGASPGQSPSQEQASLAEQAALANWPQWRGPRGTGVAPSSDAPLRFSSEAGVKWKAEIPGRGLSSPIVWGDLVFVTTAVATQADERPSDQPRRWGRQRLVPHDFRLLAFARDTGELVWSRTAITTAPHEGHHRTLSSYANASPVTDGETVYAFFGSRGLYAYDFKGDLLWSRDFGVRMRTFSDFGEASSPALFGNTVVVLFDHQEQSFVEAVDKRSGKTLWKQLRDEATTWASPHIVVHSGRAQVVTSGGNYITGYDLASGEVIWRSAGMTPYPIPTPVSGGGLLFAASGSSERRVRAIQLGGTGDLSDTSSIVWRLDKAAPYNSSPLLWDDELYLVRDGGMNVGTSRLSVLDARTGRPHYLEGRLPGSYTIKASPVGAGGKVYLASEEGDVIVVRRGPRLEVLAVNPMSETFIASPAIAGGEIFLRGLQHLICVSGVD